MRSFPRSTLLANSARRASSPKRYDYGRALHIADGARDAARDQQNSVQRVAEHRRNVRNIV